MNQFNRYEFKKHNEAWSIANDFDYILNNIWCTYSFEKGRKRWKEIMSKIPESFRTNIDTEIGHVMLGHGIEQARQAVKEEMEKYIEYLLTKT